MKYVYVILIVIPLASAEIEIPNIVNQESFVNINNLVDRFIPEISQFIIKNNLDPLTLPSTQIKLWNTLAHRNILNQSQPMIYKADLVLHSGILTYLSNLKRYGDALLNYEDKALKLNVSFEFELLKGSYNYIVKLVFFNLDGRILAAAENVRVKINISFDAINSILSLDDFELQIPGDIKITIENKNGLVEWLNTALINLATPFIKNTLTNVVQQEASNAIRTSLDKINHVISQSD
ncbi:uncharacterized protein LOC105204001 [Solenopsis invicta]|uniref:uncharacterized protein LOC105204001 n=1 Tax=Solenopsis invicta TaxID=13686 RepID=UPI00193EB6D3|nr:uncharacterized protein LOC105204001 [Solenopsis invicta]